MNSAPSKEVHLITNQLLYRLSYVGTRDRNGLEETEKDFSATPTPHREFPKSSSRSADYHAGGDAKLKARSGPLSARRMIATPSSWSRFAKKFIRRASGCWEWIASKESGGYGRFFDGGHRRSAHRWSFAFHFGEAPAGLDIAHKCHNRSCVNPAHLEAVPHVKNMADARKPTCRRGHLVERVDGRSHCAECRRGWNRAAEERRRARKAVSP